MVVLILYKYVLSKFIDIWESWKVKDLLKSQTQHVAQEIDSMRVVLVASKWNMVRRHNNIVANFYELIFTIIYIIWE